MNRSTHICALAILALGIEACVPSQLAPKAYVAWVRDHGNGWVQEASSDSFQVRVQLKPADYVLLVERREKDLASLPDSLYRALHASADRAFQFTLRLSPVKGSEFLAHKNKDAQDYYRRLEYFIAEVQEDLELVVDGDTVPCAFTHFTRTYGAAPYDDLLVSFDAIPATVRGDVELIYDDHALGFGRRSFRFQRERLNDLPDLKRS